jgi:uncharacterized protein Veg
MISYFGFAVLIKFKDGRKETLRNITEIHYNYPSALGKKIAFESGIHCRGCSYSIEDVEEFETIMESKIRRN